MAVKPLSYAKNVAKSLGYISIKTIGGIDSDLTDYAKDTADNLKSMYQSVKDFKDTLKGKSLKDSEYGNAANTFLKNVASDLKSGKWYNPDRQSASDDKYFSELTGMDFDFDWDDDDWDNFDEDLEEDSVSKSDVKTASDKVAAVTAKSSYGSSTRIIQGANLNTKALIKSNTQMFGRLNTSVAALTGSVLNLHKSLAEPLDAHIKNSTTFYEFSTNEMSKQTELLVSINTILTNRYGADGMGRTTKGGNNTSRGKSNWQKVTQYGMPDLAEFTKAIKNNALEAIPGGTMLSVVRDMLTPDMLQMFMGSEEFNSPIAALISMGLAGAIRNTSTGRAIGRAPTKLKNAFSTRVAKWNQQSRRSSGLMGILGSIFDISPRVNNKRDLSQYEKGPVDWTGIDSRALTYVIPMQLSAILSALTGQEAKLYNYKTGKWDTGKNALAAFKKEQRQAIDSATYEFRNSLNTKYRIKIGAERGSIAEASFDREIGKLMLFLANNNINPQDILDDPAKMKDTLFKKGLLARKGRALSNEDQVHEESFDQMISILGGSSNSSLRHSFVNAGFSARTANNDFIQKFNTNSSQHSALATMDRSGILNTNYGKAMAKPIKTPDGFVGNNILSTRDKLGNNLFFYLQDYYKQFRMLTHSAVVGNSKTRTKSLREISRESGQKLDNIRKKSSKSKKNFRVPDNSSRVDDYQTYVERYNAAINGVDEWQDPLAPGNQKRLRKTTSRRDRELNEAQRNKQRIEEAEAARQEERESQQSTADEIIDTLVMLITGEKSIRDVKSKLLQQGGLLGAINGLPYKFDQFKSNIKNKIKDKFTQFKDSEFGKRFFGDSGGSIYNFLSQTLGTAYHNAKVRTKWLINGYKSGEFDTRDSSAGIFANRYGTGSGLYYNFTGGASKRIPKTVKNVWPTPSGVTYEEVEKARKIINSKKYSYDSGANVAYFTTTDNVTGAHHRWETTNKKIVASVKPATVEDKFRNVASRAKNDLANSEVAQDVKKVGVYVLNKAKQSTDKFFGTDTGKEVESIGKEVKNFLPETLRGGAIGAITGAVATGSGLGLLGGFVVGAGVSLLKNSQAVNEKFFGIQDAETGDYVGGLMPTKVSNFFKKRFPEMKKSMVVGSILGGLGVVPGGLLGGFVLGSGFELVKGTKGFNDAIFGPEGVDGKRRGGLIGALKNNIVDPLVDFAKENIGKGGEKIKDFFKKNITDPLKNFFNPLKSWAKGFARKLARGARNKIAGVTGNIGRAVSNTLQRSKIFRAGKWAGKRAIGIAKGVATVPGRALNAAGDALTAHNIKAGYDERDISERLMDMSANPNAFRKNFDIKTYNRALGGEYEGVSDFGSVEDLQNLAFVLGGSDSIKRQYKNDVTKVSDTIAGSINGGGDNTTVLVDGAFGRKKKVTVSKAINDALKKGDLDSAQKYIENLGDNDITPERKQKLLEYFGAQRKILEQGQRMINDPNSVTEEARKALAGKGITKGMLKEMNTAAVKNQIDTDLLKMKRDSATDIATMAKAEKERQEALDTIPIEEKEKLDKMESIDSHVEQVVELLGGKPADTTEASSDADNPGLYYNFTGGASKRIPKTVKLVSDAAKKLSNWPSQDTTKDKNFVESEILEDGSVIQTTINSQGEKIVDRNDANTNRVLKEKAEDRALRNRFFSLMVDKKNGLINKLKGLFGGGKEGDEEKKDSIFSKIFEKLSGLFGSAVGGLGTILASLLPGGVTGIANAIAAIIPGALGAAGIGLLGKSLNDKYAGTDYDPNNRKDLDNEQVKEQTKNLGLIGSIANGFDSLVNRVTGKNMNTYLSTDYVSDTASKRVGKGLAKAVTTAPFIGKASAAVASKVPVVGKALGWGLNKLSGLGNASVIEDAALASTALIEKITPVLSKAFSLFGVDTTKVTEAATKISDKILEVGGSKVISGALKTVGAVVYFGSIILAVVSGAFEGKTMQTLGITDPPTPYQRFLSAIMNGLNAAIPFIGGIIPPDKFFDIVYGVLKNIPIIRKIFGDTNKLDEQRAVAEEELRKFNEQNGTTYNMEEYVVNHLGKSTLTQTAKQIMDSKQSKDYVNYIQGKAVDDNSAYLGGTGSGLVGGASGGLYDFTKHPSAIGKISNGLSNTFNIIRDKISSEKEVDLKAFVNRLWQFAKTSKSMTQYDTSVKEFMHQSGTSGEDEYSISNMQIQISSTLMRYVVSFMRPFMYIADQMDKMNENTTDTGDMANTVSGASSTDQTSANGIFTKVRGWFKGLFGGSSHVMQTGDDKFGNSTLGENGCGPAVAATVLRQYGKRAGLRDMANYAMSNGYVAGASGTRAGYFGDIFSRNGISSSYTTSSGGINSAINSGRPTVLLGQDKSNTSKSNSPFGPNPHYVVARGAGNGNVMVDDPELSRPALYPKSILRGTKLGIMTGGDSGMATDESAERISYQSKSSNDELLERTKYGNKPNIVQGQKAVVDTPGALWNMLIGHGYTPEGAAGLMGNLFAESEAKFHILEGDAREKYRNKHGIDYTSKEYTEAVDKGLKENYEGSEAENLHPKKGIVSRYEFGHMPWETKNRKSDGTYFGQNGYGIVQWTDLDRKVPFYDYVKSKGVSIADPQTQIEYMLKELDSGARKNTGGLLATTHDLKAASDKVLVDFESPANPMQYSSLRYGYSKKFYDQYTTNPPDKNSVFDTSNVSSILPASTGTYGTASTSGNNVDFSKNGSSTLSSDTTTGTSTDPSIWDIGSILNKLFTGALTKIGQKVGGVFGGMINVLTGGQNAQNASDGSTTVHGGGVTTVRNGRNGTYSGSSRQFGSSGTVVTAGTEVPAGQEFSPVPTTGFSEKETAIVSLMNSILGKNSYSMKGARDPFSGSADCSSTVNGVLKKAIGVSPGDDTGTILDANVGRVVDQFREGSPQSKTSTGPNLANLRPGDLMLYSRPDSGYSSGRTYRVGHVEMYMGNGLRAGHGSGTGPKITDAMTDSARYILSKRYTGEGSGLVPYDFTSGQAIRTNRMSGGASGATIYQPTTVTLGDEKDELMQKLTEMLDFIKVLAANSAYAAAIPQIITAIQQLGGITAQIAGNDSNMTADTKAKIEEDISTMMARVNALATTA